MWHQGTWGTMASTYSGTCISSLMQIESLNSSFKRNNEVKNGLRRTFHQKRGNRSLRCWLSHSPLHLMNNKLWFLFFKILLSLLVNWNWGQGTGFQGTHSCPQQEVIDIWQRVTIGINDLWALFFPQAFQSHLDSGFQSDGHVKRRKENDYVMWFLRTRTL
jgi:hypothetical protein